MEKEGEEFFISKKSATHYQVYSSNNTVKAFIEKNNSNIKSKISDDIPDLTYSDQYKPERDGNVYVLRLEKSKVFVRVHTHNCNCEYEDINIVKYDKQ